MTETGLSLGTPHYMSPEQASADRDLSARSDVYSLGCVLYEMLAGQPPHTGPTAQSVLIRILTEDPRPLTELRRTVPPNVAATVMKAIEKLPADRFETAREFRDALEDPAFFYTPTERTPQATGTAAASAVAPRGRSARTLAPWAVAAIMAALAAWGWLATPATEPGVPVRLQLTGFDGSIGVQGGRQLAVSPDGRAFVVLGTVDGDPQLYIRRADDTEFRAIPGTEDARFPTFSPDGAWLAFTQEGQIRKLALAGGPTLPVAEGSAPHWGTQETIVYDGENGIHRVPSSGGVSELLVHDSIATGAVARPHLLPDGSGVLFQTFETGNVRKVMLLDFRTGEMTEIAEGNEPRYVPTGHIVYSVVEGSAFAIPFDLKSKSVRGTPVPVLPSLTVFGGGSTQLDFSRNGTLIYADRGTGAEAVTSRPLVWVGMDGTETEIPLEMEDAFVPRVSPDGRRITYAADGHVWIYDVVTGSNTQLTEDGTRNEDPQWSPDGRWVYFTSEREGTDDEDGFRKAADFTSEAERVYTRPGENEITSLSPDGRWIVVRDNAGERREDLLIGPTEPGGELRDYLRADWDELEGAVSPDGRWMAYTADEFGGPEVFVRAFPDPAEKWQVSRGGGWDPVWAPDGSALYYVSNGTLMRAEVAGGQTFSVGSIRTLFPWPYGTANVNTGFDIHPDGDRFIAQRGGGGGFGNVYVVTNWFEELKARMGEGR
jgi:serine/threonine-protein kinase